ncbi:hypothetical protein J3R83DRAFT_2897 [Lanmaoa asiatica]|nr:hypothetical protein J3R83DRAFT_2897 [Lanmaoa asiatica]
MEPDVKDHVPEMVAAHKYSDSSTLWIHGYLKLSTPGSRVLYGIVFKKLVPITTLHGDEFLIYWWQTVKCHLVLWRHGIYHRDVSASNLMSKLGKDGPASVLNDFDLSMTEGSVRGNECTGRIPFMAIKLLSKQGLAGKVNHKYEHNLESFLWVLLYICLCYDRGKVCDIGNCPFNEWVKVNGSTCGKKK